MGEKVSKAAIPAAIIVLLLTSCAGTEEFNQTADAGNVSPGNNIPASETWAKITKNRVEDICLGEAKAEAGDRAWAVRKCLCEEVVGDGMKQYYCDVFTFDPSGTKYYIRITCFLSGRTCTIQSNLGTETLTFEQLEQMYG